jgi:hypothetical protein
MAMLACWVLCQCTPRVPSPVAASMRESAVGAASLRMRMRCSCALFTLPVVGCDRATVGGVQAHDVVGHLVELPVVRDRDHLRVRSR